MNTLSTLIFIILTSLSIVSASLQDTTKNIRFIETDYDDLLINEKPLVTLNYPDSNGFCISINDMYQWNEEMVKRYGGNAILYKELRKPSILDTCVRGTIKIYNADSNSLLAQREHYYKIEGQRKIALKTLGGYATNSYFSGIGFEYIFNTYPNKEYRLLLMPEILLINSKGKLFEVQLSGPTLFGIIDGFIVKRINEEGRNIRYGLKIDGGFLITGILSEIFPSHWFKYGKGENYRTTLQPYVSYTSGNSQIDEEYRFGIVLTRWLNKDGLVFSPYK